MEPAWIIAEQGICYVLGNHSVCDLLPNQPVTTWMEFLFPVCQVMGFEPMVDTIQIQLSQTNPLTWKQKPDNLVLAHTLQKWDNNCRFLKQ